MANTPFKMKGSPMQRNFGIGSPVKQDKTSKDFEQENLIKEDPNRATYTDSDTTDAIRIAGTFHDASRSGYSVDTDALSNPNAVDIHNTMQENVKYHDDIVTDPDVPGYVMHKKTHRKLKKEQQKNRENKAKHKTFKKAFREARDSGVDTFEWKGNTYTTEKAD